MNTFFSTVEEEDLLFLEEYEAARGQNSGVNDSEVCNDGRGGNDGRDGDDNGEESDEEVDERLILLNEEVLHRLKRNDASTRMSASSTNNHFPRPAGVRDTGKRGVSNLPAWMTVTGDSNKRMRISSPPEGGLHIAAIPDSLLANVASYLPKSSRAIFAVAMTAPSSSWREFNWRQQHPSATPVSYEQCYSILVCRSMDYPGFW